MNVLAQGVLLAQALYDMQSNIVPIEKEPPLAPPPWVNARIDIPKSIRKGKTYEEILEIKKQIWQSQHKEENHDGDS